MRSYIQFLPNVNFIFAGSKQRIMQEMFASSKKPFYQSTQIINIGTINREEYACFAIAHFDERNIELPCEVFNAIYDKFSGHTWYIQNLLNRLYGYNQKIEINLLSCAIKQLIAEYSCSYADLLKVYSVGHVRLLKAIAKEGCVKEPLAGAFVSKYRLRAASSVSAALKKTNNQRVGLSVYRRICNLRPFYGRVAQKSTILR